MVLRYGSVIVCLFVYMCVCTIIKFHLVLDVRKWEWGRVGKIVKNHYYRSILSVLNKQDLGKTLESKERYRLFKLRPNMFDDEEVERF